METISEICKGHLVPGGPPYTKEENNMRASLKACTCAILRTRIQWIGYLKLSLLPWPRDRRLFKKRLLPIRTIQTFCANPFEIWKRKLLTNIACFEIKWSYAVYKIHMQLMWKFTNHKVPFTLANHFSIFENCVRCIFVHMPKKLQCIHVICVFQFTSLQGWVWDPQWLPISLPTSQKC